MLSPAVPPFGAPKVEEKMPHSTKSCHTKTDLQTRRAPEKKQIQGRQGSQPSAARKTEKNSRNRQQGRNSSWKVFSGSPFFLREEELLPRRLPPPSDSPCSGQDSISAFFPSLHSFTIGNRHHPKVRPSICLKKLTRFFTSICVKILTIFFTSICVKMLLETRGPEKKKSGFIKLTLIGFLIF